MSIRKEYRNRRDLEHDILKYISEVGEATRVELFHHLKTTYTTILKYEIALHKDGLISINPPHKILLTNKGKQYVAALDIASAIRNSSITIE